MKKFALRMIIFSFVFMILLSGLAFAEPQSIPNGPWINDEEPVQLNAFMSNEELGKTLSQIEARAKGVMTLEIASYSTTGLPIYLVKFGDADPSKIRVLIESQIHGNQPLSAEACVALIEQLALSNRPDIKNILQNVTVWIFPRLNVEGAAFKVDGQLVQRRRNTQTWDPTEWGLPSDTDAPWYYCSSFCDPPGFDINRDFNPDLNFILSTSNASLLPGNSLIGGFFVTPEARAMRDIYKELQPDVFIDLQQGDTRLVSEEDNSMCTLQILAQAVSADRCTPGTLDPNVLDFSKQINVYVYQKLQELGTSPFTGIQRYPTVDLPGTSLGAFLCNGTATMLYETRMVGQKSLGILARQVILGVTTTLKGLADGSVFEVDPDIYDTIPPAGPIIHNPHP